MKQLIQKIEELIHFHTHRSARSLSFLTFRSAENIKSAERLEEDLLTVVVHDNWSRAMVSDPKTRVSVNYSLLFATLVEIHRQNTWADNERFNTSGGWNY